MLPSSRTLLEGKSVENLIQGTWASVYEIYVAVVTATTLLLKLGARVHDWASRGTSLRGPSFFLKPVILVIRVQIAIYFV